MLPLRAPFLCLPLARSRRRNCLIVARYLGCYQAFLPFHSTAIDTPILYFETINPLRKSMKSFSYSEYRVFSV